VVRITSPPPPVAWRVWPLWDGGIGSQMWLLLGPALGWAAAVQMQSAAWGVTVGAVLAICVWRLFPPLAFELSPEGIEQRWLGRRRKASWRRFRRWRQFHDGLFLSSSADPAPSDVTEGLYLPIPARRTRTRERVANAVRYYMGREAED
jgi:hypothetical protein